MSVRRECSHGAFLRAGARGAVIGLCARRTGREACRDHANRRCRAAGLADRSADHASAGGHVRGCCKSHGGGAGCHRGYVGLAWQRPGKHVRGSRAATALGPYKALAGQEEAARIKTAKDIWKVLVEETYSIRTVGFSPAMIGVRSTKDTAGSVPKRQLNAQHDRTSAATQPISSSFS